MSPKVLVVLATLLAGTLLSACSGATTSGSGDSAEVTSFDVSDFNCGAAVTAKVTVTWETTNTTGVEIAVDDFAPKTYGANGATRVLVACDEGSHTITITPDSGSELGRAETKDISPGQ